LDSKKIYLIRHGQTDFNLQGIVQGSGVDSSLNDMGRAQALAFYKAYHAVPFKAVYTSALRRTLESVQLFVNAGIPHVTLPGLNEISWGNKEGQPITPEEDVYYHWVLNEWQKGNTSLKIEGGESPDEVAIRQKKAFEYILSRTSEDTILICMHGRALRILLCQLLNFPLQSMELFEHKNLCLYQLTFTGTMFRIDLNNDTRHLDRIHEFLPTELSSSPQN
jgi:broad specificity phosphatase PhoE